MSYAVLHGKSQISGNFSPEVRIDPFTFIQVLFSHQFMTEIKYGSQTMKWHSATEPGPRVLQEPERTGRGLNPHNVLRKQASEIFLPGSIHPAEP